MDPTANDTFQDGALKRVSRAMAVLAAVALPVLLWREPWPVAAGFFAGGLVSAYSFHSLDKGTNALLNRIMLSGEQTSNARIVVRFALRYVVIAAVAYAILTGSRAAFYGMIAGMFLPVAGVACEAMFELYFAFRRGD